MNKNTWIIGEKPIACSNFALSNIRGKKKRQEVGICKLGILKSGFCIPFLFSEIDSAADCNAKMITADKVLSLWNQDIIMSSLKTNCMQAQQIFVDVGQES